MKKQIVFFMISFTLFFILHVSKGLAYNIAGFISQGFTQTSDNNFFTDTGKGSFQFNELGVNINTRISPVMRAGVQLISYTVGELGKNELAVDWGVADFSMSKYLGIKAGIVKVPIGLYNETRDIDASYLPIYLPPAIYPIGERDASLRLSGVGIYGGFQTKFFGDFDYQILAGRPDMDETKGSAKIFEDISPSSWKVRAVNIDTSYTVDIKYHTFIEGLLLGVNYQYSSLDLIIDILETGTSFNIDVSQTDIWGFSARYEWRNISIDYEIHNRIAKVDIPVFLTNEKTTSRGWYTSVKYIFTDHIQAGVYYSEYFDDIDDRSGKVSILFDPDSMAWQEEICLSIRFDITDTWIFKIENHWVSGTSRLLKADHMDINGNIEMIEKWRLFAAKLSYTF